MNYMIVFTGGGNFARAYDQEDFETFVSEGTPVLVFSDEDDIANIDVEYEWV